jgi:spoIIIJ-associated protein
MNTAEGTGRTVEEAVASALKQLGSVRDEVDIEVIQEPRPALLGLGGRGARVRITRRPTAAEECGDFVAGIIGMMGYEARIDARDTSDGITVVLEGDDLVGLIGRHGRTLDSLEFLVALHENRRIGHRVQVTLDAAGYRARREKSLLDMAHQAVERAVAEGRPIPLEPMEPRDRRTIHLALADNSQVTTTSQGEDEARHVVIVPREPGGQDQYPDESPEETPHEAPAGE